MFYYDVLLYTRYDVKLTISIICLSEVCVYCKDFSTMCTCVCGIPHNTTDER